MTEFVTATISVYIQQLATTEDLRAFPLWKAHEYDAGWDIAAAKKMEIEEKTSVNVPTNFAIAMPDNWCAIIRPRSSTLKRHKLIVMEGVIDSGYRGEMFFEVYNPTEMPITIRQGWRLAQLLFVPVPHVKWQVVSSLPRSTRDADGFGSTGW
jgi:dUTP pyrophosphatase